MTARRFWDPFEGQTEVEPVRPEAIRSYVLRADAVALKARSRKIRPTDFLLMGVVLLVFLFVYLDVGGVVSDFVSRQGSGFLPPVVIAAIILIILFKGPVRKRISGGTDGVAARQPDSALSTVAADVQAVGWGFRAGLNPVRVVRLLRFAPELAQWAVPISNSDNDQDSAEIWGETGEGEPFWLQIKCVARDVVASGSLNGIELSPAHKVFAVVTVMACPQAEGDRLVLRADKPYLLGGRDIQLESMEFNDIFHVDSGLREARDADGLARRAFALLTPAAQERLIELGRSQKLTAIFECNALTAAALIVTGEGFGTLPDQTARLTADLRKLRVYLT